MAERSVAISPDHRTLSISKLQYFTKHCYSSLKLSSHFVHINSMAQAINQKRRRRSSKDVSPQNMSGRSSIASPASTMSTPLPSTLGALSSRAQSPTSQASPILDLPSEIIHRILIISGADDPATLAAISQTCKPLHAFVYGDTDSTLWKSIHLQLWDDPSEACAFADPRSTIDWKTRTQNREWVARMIEREDEPDLEPHLDRIIQTILDLYLDLPTRPKTPIFPRDKDARNIGLLDRFLESPAFDDIKQNLSLKMTSSSLRPLRSNTSNPYRRITHELISPEYARIHLLRPFETVDELTREDRLLGAMREVVYTASNFTENNDWGPFDVDGKVDWKLLDAVSTVMVSNGLTMMASEEDDMSTWQSRPPPVQGLHNIRGLGWRGLGRPPDLGADEVWDWAGVAGEWCGSYAFIDYVDWVTLNHPRLLIHRPNRPILDLSSYSEAVGDLMILDLKVLPAGQIPKDLPRITTDLPTGPLPSIHFTGSSVAGAAQGMPSSFVRGVVQLTADNPPEIRWTLVIRYGGVDRWRLECVQPGGRGSARGFFGIWTDAAREEQSPNGPVWYWKA